LPLSDDSPEKKASQSGEGVTASARQDTPTVLLRDGDNSLTTDGTMESGLSKTDNSLSIKPPGSVAAGEASWGELFQRRGVFVAALLLGYVALKRFCGLQLGTVASLHDL
jgi:hypothetical protein